MQYTAPTLATAPKRAARAPRRFTAVHILPAGGVPDVSALLIEFFGPALQQAIESRAAAVAPAGRAVMSLVPSNSDLR